MIHEDLGNLNDFFYDLEAKLTIPEIRSYNHLFAKFDRHFEKVETTLAILEDRL